MDHILSILVLDFFFLKKNLGNPEEWLLGCQYLAKIQTIAVLMVRNDRSYFQSNGSLLPKLIFWQKWMFIYLFIFLKFRSWCGIQTNSLYRNTRYSYIKEDKYNLSDSHLKWIQRIFIPFIQTRPYCAIILGLC